MFEELDLEFLGPARSGTSSTAKMPWLAWGSSRVNDQLAAQFASAVRGLPMRIDVLDEIGDGHVRGGQLLDVALFGG